MRFASLDQWLQWLEQLHPSEIELGLARISQVAARLGVLPLRATVITVAGTNGKGSTIAALQSLLAAATPAAEAADGKTCASKPCRVGVYTSPHLQQFNERIVLDGEPVDGQTICQALHRVDQARGDISLTYFEFTTLAALVVFDEAEPEYLLLEVGLGGRLDAVNIVDADIAVVTAIALDHQDWLGKDRESIALEKAGILRAGRPAVIVDPDPPWSLLDYANKLPCPVWRIGSDFGYIDNGQVDFWCHASAVQGSTRGTRNEDLLARHCLPRPALHAGSWAAALQVAQLLGLAISDADLQDLLCATHLPGRQSRHSFCGRNFLLDVAHNPHAVARLADTLDANSVEGETVAILALMSDKDVEQIIALLEPKVDRWYLPALPGLARAMDPAAIASSLSVAKGAACKLMPDTASSIKEAIQSTTHLDKIIIVGSFHVVGAALDVFEADTQEGATQRAGRQETKAPPIN